MDKNIKNEIINKVNEILNEAEKNSVNERKNFDFFENQIKLNQSISAILKESKNEKLNSFCRDYAKKITNGIKESMLYESFISGVSQWNWLNAVDTELSAISDRINKYKQEIDFSKIINTMKETDSYYIVPLIEEVVLNYVNDKSAANRTILKDRLMCFHHDPYVNEMLNILYYDRSINESLNLDELEKQVRNKVSIEKIYSPIKVIKENECIFNVKGTYYNRKGNNITRISRKETELIDENFKSLCDLINSDFVKINEDSIDVFDNTKIAHITNEGVFINDKPYSIEELKESKKIAFFARDNEKFYDNVLKLNENFNNIACVDFAKRVNLNSNIKRSVDIFKIKENLSITTHDEMGRHTFYRNSNPIQTANIINEHMNLNISNLFEELQSNSSKIREEIMSTRKSYENCISELKEKLNQLESCIESCVEEKDVKEVNKLKEEVEDELKKVENDYKEYQKNSDEFLKGKGEIDSIDPAFNDEEEVDSENVEVDDEEKDLSDDEMDVETPIENRPKEYDGFFDETPYKEEKDEFSPQIVNISYETNIKTGKVLNKGEVNILVPSVNSNGDVKNELQKITFTLDSDRMPIINNEYMPVMLYNMIKDAIINDEKTQYVEFDEVADDTEMEKNIDSSVNPIDVAYGIEEPEEKEYDNLETRIEEPEEKDDEEKYLDYKEENDETTSDEEFEAVMEEVDLIENGIMPNRFQAYTKLNNIPLTKIDNSYKVKIKDGECYNKFRDFFLDNGWTKNEFKNFFPEFSSFDTIQESNKVVIKYSNKVEDILESNNLPYKISKKGDKIMIKNAICEGVTITVKDDVSGKTVTINTDELSSGDKDVEEHEKNTEEDITFGDDNAQGQEIKDEEKSEEEKEEVEDVKDSSIEQKNESVNNEDEIKKSIEKENEKNSKKFRIKKKKTNESLGITEYDKINENDVNIFDEVKYKNKKGNVISKLSNGNVIVQFGGETDILKPLSITLLSKYEIPNKVKAPTTESDAEPTNESYCGIFLNNVRISPINCKTNKEKYLNAKENDLIDVIVEGVNSSIEKQYVKLIE